MSKLLILIMFVCLFASIGSAQSEYHKFEVYGGYSRDISSNPNFHINRAFNEREAGNGEAKSFQGFNASATFNFSKYLGIKADVADHFSTGTIQAGVVTGNAGGPTDKSRLTIQGGLQFKNNSKEARWKPFGHVLAGINRQTMKINSTNQTTLDLYGSDKVTSSGLAVTFGGGLDVKVSRRIDIRAIQFNYTINSIQEKTLGQVSNLTGGFYTTSLAGGTQNQLTFGFGIVFH